MANTTNQEIAADKKWHAVGSKHANTVIECASGFADMQFCFSDDSTNCPGQGHLLTKYKPEAAPSGCQVYVKNNSNKPLILVVTE